MFSCFRLIKLDQNPLHSIVNDLAYLETCRKISEKHMLRTFIMFITW